MFSERLRFDDVVVETFVSAGFADQAEDLALEADFHEAVRLAEDGRQFGEEEIEPTRRILEPDLVQIRLDNPEFRVHEVDATTGFPGDDGRKDAKGFVEVMERREETDGFVEVPSVDRVFPKPQ